MKIMVIGGSHGGYEAVQAIHEQQPEFEIDWYDQVDLLAAGNWRAAQSDTEKDNIRGMTATALATNRIQLHGHQQATHLDSESHTVTFTNSLTQAVSVVRYDRLILAIGARATTLPVPGHGLAGIMTIRHGQSKAILQQIMQDAQLKKIVIIGTRYIGMMAANAFSQAKQDITMIDMQNRPLGTYLDPELTAVLTETMQQKGLQLALEQRISHFEGDLTGHVTQVVTDKGTYDADLVVLSAGTQPNTEWLKGSMRLNQRGMIETDDYQQTSEADVFAIGDATEIRYTPTDQKMLIALASNALHQARTAVANLLSPTHALTGVQGSSALRLFGQYFASTGVNATTANRLELTVKSVYVVQENITDRFRRPSVPVQFKLYYQPKSLKILGAQIMSTVDQTQQINTMSVAIQLGMTVSQLADADFFFQPELTNEQAIMTVAAQKALAQEH